jgi:nucleotide-binding universal stress UspA family protein
VNTTYVVQPAPKTLALARTVPIGKGTDGLLQTADKAVRLLAARDGVKLPAVSASTSSGSSTDTIVIAVAAAAGVLIVAGAEFARRSRRRRRLAPPAEEGGQP